MWSRFTRPAAAALAAIAALLAWGAASASASLNLVSIAGPNGTVPFKSPGGMGPTFVASPPGDTHRVFVGTKDGYIYIVKDGVTQPTPFLDIHTQVSTTNEDGMFSLVFDPNFATNRWFYVDYSDTVANNAANKNVDNYHLDAFQASASNPDVADAATQRQILFNPTSGCLDMSSAHYGGQLAFGPDGHLWLSLGDGGDGGGDPATRGPNCDRSSPLWAPDLTSIRGKILRIDPQPTAAPDANGNRYTIPSDNPLVGQGGGVRTEVWAYGLRNPWRFSFDSASPHNLIIGDVGNAQQEEIDAVPSTLAPGAAPPYFGWPCMEGTIPFFPAADCPGTPTPIAPVLTYNHTVTGGKPDCMAIIGGVVLHDASLGGDYNGRYVYSFFCGGVSQSLAGELFTTNLSDAIPTPRDENVNAQFGVSSFGTDACGHPYVTNVSKGGLSRIEGPTPGSCGTDTTPPDTSITAGPTGLTNASTASFSFTSTETGSTFTCQLDSGAATSCTSPKQYTGLSEGAHTLTVTATDAAGNSDPTPATRSWTVDTTPPDTTIDAAPSGTVATTSASISFHSTDAGATFTCKLDSAAPTACISPKQYTSLGDGPHTVTVTATDAAGNTNPSPATVTWTIDATPPDTSITSGPPGLTNSSSASLDFTSTEAGSTFTCQLDSGAVVQCSSPVSYTDLSDGSHTVTVTATDAVGNADQTPATRSWSVDTTPPDTTIASSPTGSVSSTSASISFTSSEVGSTFTCALDGGAAIACSSPKLYSGLGQGLHTVTVVATDAVGNADPTAPTASWTVDTVPPDTAITGGPPTSDTHSSATFTLTSSESPVTYRCALDSAAFAACTSPATVTGLANGQHKFSVEATDAAGNTDPTPVVTFWTVTLPTTTTTTTTTATTTAPSSTTTTTTTTTPPPTTTTPVTGQSAPPIHISLRGLKSLLADKHGTLRLRLGTVGQAATGVVTLRSGTHTLAPAFHFRMRAGKGVTLVLVLSRFARTSLKHHRWITARLTLTLRGASNRATASVSVRIGMAHK